MKHLMTLMALVVAVTAGAQVMDTIVIENEVHINLNYAKVDSILDSNADLLDSNADLQAQVDALEAAPTFYADLSNVEFYNLQLDGKYLANSNLSNTSWENTVLYDANLTNANLTGADFYRAWISYANLTNANPTHASFVGVYDQDDVTWTGAYILGCTGCTCTDADSDDYCD